MALIITVKTAILTEWIRNFLPNGGDRRSVVCCACHFVVWSKIIFRVVELVLVNVSCVPYKYLWNRTIEGGYCRLDTAYTSLAATCWAFSTDIIILVIPRHVIRKLKMSPRRKLGISAVFALGMTACAASIVRLYFTVGRSESADLTYHKSSVQLTAVGESACAILVLCVPAMPEAVAALGSSRLASSIRSWASLVSIMRHRSSHESLEKHNSGDGHPSSPSPADKGPCIYAHIRSSSERRLVPLGQLPNMEQHDPELGNAIVRSTEFEAYGSFPSNLENAAQEHDRQHPWIQR